MQAGHQKPEINNIKEFELFSLIKLYHIIQKKGASQGSFYDISKAVTAIL